MGINGIIITMVKTRIISRLHKGYIATKNVHKKLAKKLRPSRNWKLGSKLKRQANPFSQRCDQGSRWTLTIRKETLWAIGS